MSVHLQHTLLGRQYALALKLRFGSDGRPQTSQSPSGLSANQDTFETASQSSTPGEDFSDAPSVPREPYDANVPALSAFSSCRLLTLKGIYSEKLNRLLIAIEKADPQSIRALNQLALRKTVNDSTIKHLLQLAGDDPVKAAQSIKALESEQLSLHGLAICPYAFTPRTRAELISEKSLPEDLLNLEEMKDKGMSVLDVGAGYGKLVKDLQAAGIHAIGLDKEASPNQPPGFIHADAEHIPLPDQSVDRVYSTWSMFSAWYIEDLGIQSRILNEISRVLKHGGDIILSPVDLETMKYLLKRHPELELARYGTIIEKAPQTYWVKLIKK